MQVIPSIHALRHTFRILAAPGIVLDRFSYSYLVYGETITLIDTGVAGCERQIFDYIFSTGRYPSEIAQIVLTHSHPDHIGAASAIQKETGCIIAAHPAERAWIEDVELQNRERPVPGFTMLVGGSVHVDHLLMDGISLTSGMPGSGEIRVMHTPGHSPGSISLFIPECGALFSGDAIPVPGDLPVYDDALASVQSMQWLRQLGGIRVLLPAWQQPSISNDPYCQMDQAIAYLQVIHEAVLVSIDAGSSDTPDITRRTAMAIGLPPEIVNPLLFRTITANLRVRDRKNLL